MAAKYDATSLTKASEQTQEGGGDKMTVIIFERSSATISAGRQAGRQAGLRGDVPAAAADTTTTSGKSMMPHRFRLRSARAQLYLSIRKYIAVLMFLALSVEYGAAS